jgi:hypothetical protein
MRVKLPGEQIGLAKFDHAESVAMRLHLVKATNRCGNVIILSGEHVHAAESKTKHNGARNMNVGVKPKGHYGWPRGQKRAENAKGPAAARRSGGLSFRI